MAELIEGLGRIWLIGGTQESAVLARAIAASQISCIISVTTESARSLYPTAPNLVTAVGCLTAESLPAFWQAWQVAAVLDASHPFAVEISELAIAAAAQLSIPYLRFERPLVNAELNAGLLNSEEHHSEEYQLTPYASAIFDSFDDLLAGNYLTGQRVLLTIGYRWLQRFQPWQERATLFARILPSVTALEAAIAAGFPPERLIALRPPIAAEMERALWRQWQISLVVTKASGAPGGEDVKRQVAAELGISLVAIARPEIVYPNQTSDVSVALQFCRQHLQ